MSVRLHRGNFPASYTSAEFVCFFNILSSNLTRHVISEIYDSAGNLEGELDMTGPEVMMLLIKGTKVVSPNQVRKFQLD